MVHRPPEVDTLREPGKKLVDEQCRSLGVAVLHEDIRRHGERWIETLRICCEAG